MPKVVVTGGTQKQRSLVKKAAAFYLRTLLSGKTQQSILSAIHIDIELIEDLFDEEWAKGDCEVLDSSEDAPLDFEIRIDSSMNMAAILMAVAHEMVHVKQYALGELKDASGNRVLYKGKLFVIDEKTYFDNPWEIEAYGREDGLLYRFVQEHDLIQSKWYSRDPDYL